MVCSRYLVFFLFVLCAFGQDKPPEQLPPEQLPSPISSASDPNIHSIAPIKASFYSALVPGLGQIYNRKYWKLPIVYGLLGGAFYFFYVNDRDYERVRYAYKRRQAGFTDDEFYNLTGSPTLPSSPSVDNQTLLRTQESVKQDRDLGFILILVAYALNIIDATVDAHLKHFTINDDLSFKVKPYLNQGYNTAIAANAGVCLTLNL